MDLINLIVKFLVPTPLTPDHKVKSMLSVLSDTMTKNNFLKIGFTLNKHLAASSQLQSQESKQCL